MGTIDYNDHLNKLTARGQADLITMFKCAFFWLRSTAAASLVCLLFLPGVQADSSLQVGDRAADWVLTDPDGKTITFYQDSDQRPAVLLFWASWCNTCAELIPELGALREQLDQHKVRFYALNIWEDSIPTDLLEEQDSAITFLLNADRVAKRYKVRRTPGLFVVNADKSIRYIRRGNSSNEEVLEAIKAAVAAHN